MNKKSTSRIEPTTFTSALMEPPGHSALRKNTNNLLTCQKFFQHGHYISLAFECHKAGFKFTFKTFPDLLLYVVVTLKVSIGNVLTNQCT